MGKFTVIDGGKTSTPGATHTHETHAAPSGATPVSKVCKSGLLIRFDGTMFEHLPGVAVLDASQLPEMVVLSIIGLAVEQMGKPVH